MPWISKDARDVPPDYSTHHCHPKTLIRTFSLMQKAKENLDNGLNLTQGIISHRMDRENVDDDDLKLIASDRSAGIKRKGFDKNITDCKDCQQFCVELNCKKQLNRELMKHNEQLRKHNKILSLSGKKKTMVV
ncbi:hypothetical protein FQA39_LY00838 [Lamprigera yunnana]|nr:hypothetical protein FQA39_LY00838 [Lamprigera yunnana]